MRILMVSLEEEIFAIDIKKIKLIREIVNITRVPSAPGYIKGIMDSAGNIITVIDMKFLLDIDNKNSEKNIVIFNAEKEKVGIAVDKALEVLEVDEDKIEVYEGNKFLYGIAEVKEKKVFIINTDNII
ncbi:chemotaxis protein CheW [Clostridium sp.]|uniref:chemotaxis protein CheW n=1 Tax=Clostridium sp. TaxID=1506 RepID=UPI002A892234|nr:chemotaxis protein CheW [Clostridium sp.]